MSTFGLTRRAQHRAACETAGCRMIRTANCTRSRLTAAAPSARSSRWPALSSRSTHGSPGASAFRRQRVPCCRCLKPSAIAFASIRWRAGREDDLADYQDQHALPVHPLIAVRLFFRRLRALHRTLAAGRSSAAGAGRARARSNAAFIWAGLMPRSPIHRFED